MQGGLDRCRPARRLRRGALPADDRTPHRRDSRRVAGRHRHPARDPRHRTPRRRARGARRARTAAQLAVHHPAAGRARRGLARRRDQDRDRTVRIGMQPAGVPPRTQDLRSAGLVARMRRARSSRSIPNCRSRCCSVRLQPPTRRRGPGWWSVATRSWPRASISTVRLPKPARQAAIDDMLDAGAAAWSATRVEQGVAIAFPDPPGAEVPIWA